MSDSSAPSGPLSTDAPFADLQAWFEGQRFTDDNRPIRLRLSGELGWLDNVLMAQKIDIAQSLCGPLRMRMLCVSTRADLALKLFTGLAVEVQIVTDRGALRSVCGIVKQVTQGQSDGGFHTLMIEATDGLSLLEQRVRSRVFQNKTVPEIVREVLDEWVRSNTVIGQAFSWQVLRLDEARYPRREFVRQCDESDSTFLQRLLRSAGISWFVRAGHAAAQPAHRDDDTPAHTLMLFDDAMALPQNNAGTVRYHREGGAAEQRDTITLWSATRQLVAGSQVRSTWDYKRAAMTRSETASLLDQGQSGNALAAALQEALTESPHWADNDADHQRQTTLRMQRREQTAKHVSGVSGVRDFDVGSWFAITGHPALDSHPEAQRRYILTEVRHRGQNNLPKTIGQRVSRLFAANGWDDAPAPAQADAGAGAGRSAALAQADSQPRYSNTFTCVRRDTALVPAFDPRVDWPRVHPLTAIVVGPAGEEVHTDEQGRIKVQFQGLSAQDHAHAQGAGASGTERDSAWVRQASPFAGRGFGHKTLHRVGDEVLVDFLNGDPDKPVILAALYRPSGLPPAFAHTGSLPANRYVSGLKTQEIGGARYNQLRMDDTPGQISTQLASEHAHSQLNLGYLSQPRSDGKGEPRGEGSELRTDASLAARGARGVYITADAQPQGRDHHLERSTLIGLADALQGIQQQLSDLSATHNAEATDAARLQRFIERLKAWDNGSNVLPKEAAGGAPIVAVSAPAGIGVASQDNLLLGAQTHIDTVSIGNTQLSAGQKLLIRCGGLFSAFAHGAMKLIAHGKLEVQSHADSIELTAARRIVLTAGDEIVLQAPSIRYVAQGAQVDLRGGQITQQSAGGHVIKSASFDHLGPGGGAPPGVELPRTEVQHDQQVILTDMHTAEPLGNRGYRIRVEDGQILEGRTNAEGRTGVFDSALAYARYTIELLD